MAKIYLFVDIDGTIAEWKVGSSLCDLHKKGFFYDVKPNKELISFIQSYLNNERIEIYILTAYISQQAIEDKNKWLDEHMPIIRQNRIFVPDKQNKAKFVENIFKEKLDKSFILLDDHTPNLIQWEEAGGTAIKALNGINRIEGKWKGLMFDVFDLKIVQD